MGKGFDINSVRHLMRTEPNEAMFWSGSTSISKETLDALGLSEQERAAYTDTAFEARHVSETIARKYGRKTLEMKIEENLDALLEAGFPYYEEYNDETRPAWEAISAAYAEGASGEVCVIHGMDAYRTGTMHAGDEEERPFYRPYVSVWHRTEMLRVKNNPNITGITVVDPFGGGRMERFTRDEIVITPDEPWDEQAAQPQTDAKESAAQAPKQDRKFSVLTFALTALFAVAAIVTFCLQGEGYFVSRPLSWIGAVAAFCAEVYLLKRLKLLRANKIWSIVLLVLLAVHMTVIPYLLNELFMLLLLVGVGLFLLRFVVNVLPEPTTVKITRRDEDGRETTETRTYMGDADYAASQAESQLRSEGYTDIKRE